MAFEDEILIKDPTGKFKILRGGKFYDLEEKTAKPSAATPPSKFADEILKKSKIVLAENLKERFADIVEAYSRDVRDKFETKATLTRQVAEGGLGFSGEQVDLVIKLIKEEAASKSSDAAVKKGLPQTGVIPKKKSEAAAVKPKTPELSAGVAELVFSRSDEAEIRVARENLPKISVGQKPAEINKIIKEIITESGVELSLEVRQKLEGILLTHFKDIRDGFETREKLGGAAGPAGVTLAPEAVDKILSLAQKKLQQLDEKDKGDELQKIKMAETREAARIGEVRGKTVDEMKNKMDVRWQEIARKAPTSLALPDELVAPPVGMQVRAAGELPKISRVATLPRQMEELPSATLPSVKREMTATPPRTVKTPFDLPEEEKPKPLQILKPVTPVQVRRPLPQRDNRPRLDDVKYVPKLVGPVEELREMTLVDFRRLNANPVLVAEKIKEKIALLEREAFSKKIAGIKAWQESEINKIYLEIGRESLQKGLSADKIIAARTAAGQPTITVEEYKAIMDLNRVLRY
ncbi:MAG: hypothetical protein ABII19_00160 [Patescibacteria group bacterium]